MKKHISVILCAILCTIPVFSSCAGNGTETENPATSAPTETESLTEFDNRLPNIITYSASGMRL